MNPLELTSFEQLDLGLAMLVSNQGRLEGAQEILTPPDCDHDFRPHLETSYRIIQEIQQHLGISGNAPQPVEGSHLTGNGQSQHLQVLDWTEELMQALNQAGMLADSLRQLPSVSQQHFEGFGFFVCHWVKRFRESNRQVWQREHEKRIRPLRASLQRAVDDGGLRAGLEEVLGELLHVLCLIRHTQQALEKRQKRQQLILMMVHCIECAQRVLAQIERLQPTARSSRTGLGDALSWSSCTLKIEIRRVLKGDLHHLDGEANPNLCYEHMDRAIGILSNGFDHAIRHLLSSLDAAFEDIRLLGDLHKEYQEACLLRDSLQNLRKAAECVEKSPSGSALSSLQNAIQDFADQAFALLYRRDRRVIEELSRQVEASDAQEMALKAHQFQAFLATLLAEVRNRNVFSHFEQHRVAS